MYSSCSNYWRGAKSTVNGLLDYSAGAELFRRIAGHDHALAAGNITFKHPFRIKGIDRLLPAGAYEVITDEEMIEGLSFAVVSPRCHHDHGAGGAAAQFNDGDGFPSVRSICPTLSALTRARPHE